MEWVWARGWLEFTLTKQSGHPLRAVKSNHSIPAADVLSSSDRWGSRCNFKVRVSL